MVTCYDFCSGIQIQRSSDSNMDRLAGLGIQVSRSAEERPPPAANNDLNRLSKLGISVSSSQPDSGSHEVQSRLSGLGVSVSGGPKPPATNAAASRLPPGISVSGGLSPVKNLPPGVSHSGGPSPSKPPPHPTARAPPNLPPGISLSGGAGPGSNGPRAQGPGPRPSIPGGVSINSGTRPATTPRLPGQPPSVRMNAATRPQAVNSFPSKVNSVLKQPDIAPTLPSGVSLSVGPSKSQSPSQPPAASAPSVPSGISLSGGPSQSQPPLQAPSAPAPTLPPGVSLSGGPSQSPSQPQAKSPEQRPAASAPSLPPEVSLSSGPSHSQPPPGDSGDDVSNKVPTTSPTVSAPESESKPPEPERSKSPAETLSDIDKFVNESNQECEVYNKSEEPSACEQEINSGEETSKRTDQKELPDSSPTVEESMELDENQEDLNPESNPSTDINGEGKVHKNTTSDSAANVEKSAGADSEELKEADDTETEKSNNENQNDASVNGETGDDSEAGEGAENWDEYEGEDGWEGYEEGYEGYDGEEGYEGYEDWEEYEEDGQTDNSEKGEDGSDKKASDEDKKDTDSEEVGQDSQSKTEENGVVEDSPRPETADESNSEQMDCDDDGAPKPPGGDASGKPATEAETARRSQDEDSRQAAKLPPGISMSQVPSLPPGISISSPGKGAAAPPNLPPGISISPFKKPSGSGRHSVDEDARSQGSSRDEDAASAKSFCEGEDPVPLVGTDTLCVFCMERCSGNSPKLLTCLMSSCANCFSRKIRESIRDNSANDVVDLDGNDIQMAPEVTCTVCKSTTSEDEVMDNVFAAADPEEDLDSVEDEQHPCNSCEDNVMASHYCEDCDEYLCSDCVRAHQRVKMTKDHKIRALKVSGRSGGLDHLNYCSKCPNEKLTLYCETCDKLNCRDCQLSEQCRHHKYRYSYEVAPEVKAHLSQSVSDIRLKKSGLEESRQVLSSKIADVNAKENALIVQMREIKSYLIAKIETRHKELVTEISKICREKRKILEGRKSTLDRTYWQADYSISFVNNLLSNSVSDEKILLTKKMLYRQMKRMRRANNAVGLTLPEMELKLDLYFQHFTSQSLHTNLDNVLKMVMSDIKVSQVPIEAPKPKPLPPQPQPPPQPSPVRAAPSTPTRALPGSPQSRLSSPARLNAGLVSRQLSTPQKQVVVRGSPIRGQQGVSPARQVQHQRGQMVVQQRGGPRQLVQQQPGRGRGRGGLVVGGAVRGGHVRSLGQPGSVVMGRGGQMMQQGRGRSSGMRGGMMAGGGAMVRQAPGQRMVTPTKRGGGMVAMVGGRGAAIRPVLRGGVQGHVVPGRGGVQMVRGGGSLARQQAVPARRGRPPATGVMMNPKPLVQPQQFQQQQQYPPQQRTVITQQQRKIAPQPPQQPQPRAVSPSSSSVVSSWHTPSQNRPVSPPKSNDNFKIKLPKMSGPAGSKVKPESIDIDDDIISLDDPPPPRVNNGHNTITNFNRPGLQISRGSSNQEEGVDPLSLDDVSILFL